jgi:hypothetical protein
MMPKKSEKENWLENIQALLISVDRDYIQSCSISVVPECLKKPNYDVYMPRVVSIGPRFNDSRDELLLMEEVKLRCMLSLLHRGTVGGEINFKNCSSAVWELDEHVRASYVVGIELTQPELAKIMLLDGCFLLELLISNSEKYDSLLNRRLNIDQPSPAAEVLKNEDVLSDLMLFENQIPILVLHKLSQTLFPEVFEPDVEVRGQGREEQMKRERRAKILNNLALSLLGYSFLESPSFKSPHFLDLVHFFVNPTSRIGLEVESGGVNLNNHMQDTNRASEIGLGVESGVNLDIDHMPDTNRTSEKLKLKSCALRLRAAGVSIQVIGGENKSISCLGLITDCFGSVFIRLKKLIVKTTRQVDIVEEKEIKGLDFEFKFNNGKLEIAKLRITKSTKAKWRNVIAWEHHKSNRKCPRGKFTSSAMIFDGLICCEADLKFLKKKNIIVDDTNMSNDELKEFFRAMSLGVDPGVVDSTYVTMVNELNDYSSKAFFIFSGIFKLLWHLFTIYFEWLVIFLKRNYNFVAMFVLLFGFVRVFRSDILPLIQYIRKLDQ